MECVLSWNFFVNPILSSALMGYALNGADPLSFHDLNVDFSLDIFAADSMKGMKGDLLC